MKTPGPDSIGRIIVPKYYPDKNEHNTNGIDPDDCRNNNTFILIKYNINADFFFICIV